MMFGKNFERKLLVLALLVVFSTFSVTSVFAGPKDIKHGFLGVYLKTLDNSLREAMDYEEAGVLVEDVIKDGPADNAGIKSGDIIVKINDKNIFNVDRLRKLVALHDPGEKIDVLVFRDGKTNNYNVELGEKELFHDANVFSIHGDGGNDFRLYTDKHMGKDFFTEKKVYLGVNIEDLEEQLGDYFGVKEGKGSLVTSVFEDSPAEKAGFKAGDVIIAIGDDVVEENLDIGYILEDYKAGDAVDVKVIRNKKEKTLKVELTEPPEDWLHINVDLDDVFLKVQDGLKKSKIIISDDDDREREVKSFYFGNKAQ